MKPITPCAKNCRARVAADWAHGKSVGQGHARTHKVTSTQTSICRRLRPIAIDRCFCYDMHGRYR